MEGILHGAYLYAYVPVTTHRQISIGTEVPFSIGLYVHCTGSSLRIRAWAYHEIPTSIVSFPLRLSRTLTVKDLEPI